MEIKFLNLKFYALGLIILGSAQKSFATYFDINYLNFSDQFITSTTSQSTRTIYDVNLGFEATSSKQIVLALSVGSAKLTDVTGSTTSTFLNSDMGLKFLFYLSKHRTWSIGVVYNFTSTAKYNDGTNGELTLRGTSIKADLGYNFWLGDSVAIGLKIYYYAPSFKESITSNVITDVAYKRTLIYPNFSFIYSY